jgi:hypothetical protein
MSLCSKIQSLDFIGHIFLKNNARLYIEAFIEKRTDIPDCYSFRKLIIGMDLLRETTILNI